MGITDREEIKKESFVSETLRFLAVLQRGFLLQTKSLVETINTSTGVDQLLLAGVERVALGADLNTDLLLGRTGCEHVATCATDSSLFVVRMDAFSHVVHLFLVS